MAETKKYNGGIGLLGLMFLILFTLKLLGKIEVSWWVVTAPLWGPLALVLLIVGIIFLAAKIAKKYEY